MWRLSYYTSERVLNTLKTVEVALRRRVEQTVAVVETCTNDTNCNRFGSIECQLRTDVAKRTSVEIARTDNAGYTPIHGKCMVELDAKK